MKQPDYYDERCVCGSVLRLTIGADGSIRRIAGGPRDELVDTGLSELTVARLASLYESYQWPVLPPRVSRSRHLAEYVVAALREDARLRAALEPKP